MKSKIVKFTVLLIAVLFPAALSGQDKAIGVSAGFTYSNILSKRNTDTNTFSLMAYTQAVTGSFQISDRWFLDLGIRREKKGYRVQFYNRDVFGNAYGDPYFISQELKYLSLPVFINVQTNSKLNLYTGLGANISLLISAKSVEPWLEMQYDQNGVPTFEWKAIGERIRPNTEAFKQIDLAFAWQGGVRYPIADKLIADFKVSLLHGVIPISQDKIYNRMAGAVLGFLYTW